MERCTVAVTGTIGHGETIRHMIRHRGPKRPAAVRGRSSSDLARTIQHASSADRQIHASADRRHKHTKQPRSAAQTYAADPSLALSTVIRIVPSRITYTPL